MTALIDERRIAASLFELITSNSCPDWFTERELAIYLRRVNKDAKPNLCRDPTSDELVFDKNATEVNDYGLRWGFAEACARAEIPFGETVPRGIIWQQSDALIAISCYGTDIHDCRVYGI